MRNCYLCGVLLTPENKSVEHIILNAIGGRLKSSDLLCKNCNSKFGHDCDSTLAAQLSFLAIYLNVKREKGSHPIIKGAQDSEGKEYHIAAGGRPMEAKPNVSKTAIDNGMQYSITARNEEEMIKILKDMKKKYPQLDLEVAKQHFKRSERYLNDYLHNEVIIGGEAAMRSVTKTAVNYYIHIIKDKEQVQHLFPYIKGEIDLEVATHYYSQKPPYKRNIGEVAHMIHLVGNKRSKLLYCYIEFFSCYSFLVLLSKDYVGENLVSTYCFDVIKGKEITKSITLKLKVGDLQKPYAFTSGVSGGIVERLNRFFKIANKIQTGKAIEHVTQRAVKKVFEKYPDQQFNKVMLHELSEELAVAWVKFINRDPSNHP